MLDTAMSFDAPCSAENINHWPGHVAGVLDLMRLLGRFQARLCAFLAVRPASQKCSAVNVGGNQWPGGALHRA